MRTETITTIVVETSSAYMPNNIFYDYNFWQNENLSDKDEKEKGKPISSYAPLTGMHKSLWAI